MENLIAWLVMAGVSLPLSFLIARGCLRGLVRLMSNGVHTEIMHSEINGGERRDVL